MHISDLLSSLAEQRVTSNWSQIIAEISSCYINDPSQHICGVHNNSLVWDANSVSFHLIPNCFHDPFSLPGPEVPISSLDRAWRSSCPGAPSAHVALSTTSHHCGRSGEGRQAAASEGQPAGTLHLFLRSEQEYKRHYKGSAYVSVPTLSRKEEFTWGGHTKASPENPAKARRGRTFGLTLRDFSSSAYPWKSELFNGREDGTTTPFPRAVSERCRPAARERWVEK